MEFRNNSKFDGSVRYIYYFISGILCWFLILLTGRVLDDLGQSVPFPERATFENRALLFTLNMQRDSLTRIVESYDVKAAQLTKASELAQQNYQTAKESFENWLQARKVLGEPSKDREVIAKTEALDGYYKIQQDWNQAYSKIQDTVGIYQGAIEQVNGAVAQEEERAGKLAYRAEQQYDLKVFLIRLLFILPILFLGIYFYVKFRNHQYWPLFLGFTLYSLYAFFVGLIPYLPSYGGYVRYSVGIVLSTVGGYYAINNIRAYMEWRKRELQKSTEERAEKVEFDTAFKAFEQHVCPSCGKDFIFKNWTLAHQNPADAGLQVSNYCRQCGFELYKNCSQCGEKHFAHLPFCSHCGAGKK